MGSGLVFFAGGLQNIYLGNDISTAASMHKEDIYIRNVKIVSNSG